MEFGPHIKMTTLESGLVVITEHLRDLPILSGRIVVRTGSLHDPRHQNGLAHFAEHMINHGIPGVSGDDLEKKWDDIQFYDWNLGTSFQETNYFASGFADDVRGYLGDIVQAIQHLAYDHGAFALEQGRIINEMRMKQADRGRLRVFAMRAGLYGDQPHGQWTGGYPEHLAKMKIEDIQAYHRRTHNPANMVLISSGNWSHEDACAWAKWHLDSLPPGQKYDTLHSILKPNDIHYHDPVPSESREDPQINYRIMFDNAYHTLPEWAALRIGGGIISNRLSKKAKELGVYNLKFRLDDIFGRNAEICTIDGSSINYNRIRSILFRTMEEISHATVDLVGEDVDTIKRRLSKRSRLMEYFKASDVDHRLDWINDDYLERGDPVSVFKRRAALQAVTRDDVVGVLKNVLSRPISTFYGGDVEGRNFPSGAELSDILRRGLGVSTSPSSEARAKPSAAPAP